MALAVLGMILAGLAQATRFGMSAWGLETRLADKADELERVDRVVRNLIEQAAPAVSNGDKPFVGQEHRMVFITQLPDQPQDQPVRRAQVSLGVDDRHRLVVKWQPDANATALLPLLRPRRLCSPMGWSASTSLTARLFRKAASGSRPGRTQPCLPSFRSIFCSRTSIANGPDMAVPTMIDTNGSF